ncbi:Uncharacterised protein [uncultured archaeon]|nr:Uncharacterised protein [uncultured archaeon]
MQETRNIAVAVLAMLLLSPFLAALEPEKPSWNPKQKEKRYTTT